MIYHEKCGKMLVAKLENYIDIVGNVKIGESGCEVISIDIKKISGRKPKLSLTCTKCNEEITNVKDILIRCPNCDNNVKPNQLRTLSGYGIFCTGCVSRYEKHLSKKASEFDTATLFKLSL